MDRIPEVRKRGSWRSAQEDSVLKEGGRVEERSGGMEGRRKALPVTKAAEEEVSQFQTCVWYLICPTGVLAIALRG